MQELLTLHRYWIWANRLRHHYEAALATGVGAGPLDPDTWFAGDIGLFLGHWYSSLFVVVEGWGEMGLSDPRVDQLLGSPFVENLRRFRNGVCHFQQNYFDDRFIEIAANPASVPWVRELHQRLGECLLEQVAR